MRPALLATLSLLYASTALAQVSHFTLDNGLEAVVIEDHRAPVVTHMVWYRVGSADEVPGKSGLAHFLEHLLFQGTDDIAPGEFSRIIEANGGEDNAFTSYDQTAYHQTIAADRLGLVMQMEADRMRDLQLNEESVATERDVVLEERAQRVDSDPGALFAEQRSAALYLNHPYGRPVIGWRQEVEQLTLDDALAFYRKFYAPNDAILIVAGDIDPAEVQTLAEQYYGPLEPSRGIAPRLRPQEPPQRSPRRLVYQDDRVRQPYVIRSYLAPERNPGDQETAAALTVLAELLGGGGITSVLGKALEVDDPVAVATGAYYTATAYDPSDFGIYIVPRPDVTLEQAEAKMDAVLADFLRNGPEPAQMERIKTQIRAAEIYAQDRIDGLARRYGAGLTAGLTLADIDAWPDALAAVTPEDVLEAAQMVLDLNQSVTGWLTAPEQEAAE